MSAFPHFVALVSPSLGANSGGFFERAATTSAFTWMTVNARQAPSASRNNLVCPSGHSPVARQSRRLPSFSLLACSYSLGQQDRRFSKERVVFIG